HLRETAQINSTIIKLNEFVDWDIGEQIVIASTAPDPTQAEEAFIKSVKNDAFGAVLTLDRKLNYTHASVVELIDGRMIEIRAEVGLLSRNIVIEGDISENNQLPVTDARADLFGGHIIVFPANKSLGLASARFENVEIRNMGQAFQLGRYAVHFHQLGDVLMNNSESYVKNCAIHHTFNRAITAHATDNMLFEKNVAYNVLGHTYFIEDGVETNNTFRQTKFLQLFG
ncbi:Fibrocystin-L, partial [Nowakowskiella sp. JEL0078]